MLKMYVQFLSVTRFRCRSQNTIKMLTIITKRHLEIRLQH